MSRSSKRKTQYKLMALFIAVAVISVLSFLIFYNPPTCQDGKQNQGEEGVDCGGPCKLVCGFKIVNPIIRWNRPLKTFDGIYSVVAMIENLNVSAEAFAVPYLFKLYDDQGLLIMEREGNAFIPSNKVFPIFESSLVVDNRIPRRVSFEFTKKPEWVKATMTEPKISIKNINFFEKNNLPRVSAVIENIAVGDIKNVELVVLMLDSDNNLINSSKTVLDLIKKGSSETVIFTWPKSFEKEVFKTDIVLVSKIL